MITVEGNRSKYERYFIVNSKQTNRSSNTQPLDDSKGWKSRLFSLLNETILFRGTFIKEPS